MEAFYTSEVSWLWLEYDGPPMPHGYSNLLEPRPPQRRPEGAEPAGTRRHLWWRSRIAGHPFTGARTTGGRRGNRIGRGRGGGRQGACGGRGGGGGRRGREALQPSRD